MTDPVSRKSAEVVELANLQTVASDYDAILCDVWGVIHNGRSAFAPACDALVNFRKLSGRRVVLITNAPVPKAQVLRYFAPLGVPDEAFDDCVSSGDATRALLAKYQGRKIWRIGADEGWEHDRFLYEGLDLHFVDDPAEADLGLIIGLRDQANDHPEAYRDELTDLSKTGLELVCANPDIQVRIGDRLHWCGGALAQIYEQQGGTAIYPGKPHAAIYDLAFAKLESLGGAPDRARVLAIGDGPVTDLKGANREGLDALYVGTGLAAHVDGDFISDARSLLDENTVTARYAQPMLTW
ncbi:MAG: TIGR01459 family HAD-type hydrolase [Hyphomonadaceae bacterium]